jgi:TPR repeat protein
VTAKHWAQLGANLGNVSAAKRLETLGDVLEPGQLEYEAGLRASNRSEKAFALELFTKAMDKGHMMATAFVAEAYREGRGVAKDDVKGRQLTTRCAELGNDSCQTILAQLFMRGTGGPVDHEAARKWFETASLKGNTLAMWFLADMYDNGNGIPRNDALASYWYNVAYSKGSAKAEAVLKARGLLKPDPKTEAYLTRIEKDGPSTESVQAFMYEVAVYCKFGGKKCHELTVAGERFMQSRNATAESANLQRIWNVYAAPKGADDAAWRAKSDCMRKKTESMQRHNSGQQDWYFSGDC